MSTGAADGILKLRPVPLQELRLRADSLAWAVDQKLAELDSLTPVRGQVRVRHLGGVLEVEGKAETIVTLCCDRCLQHYNRPLQAAVHELLELSGPEAAELEGSDLTALAASAASPGASGGRSTREAGTAKGSSGSSASGRRVAGPRLTASRDGGRRDAAAIKSDLSAIQPSDSGGTPRNAPNPGKQPRRRSRSGTHPEPLLIEALDDRLDPRGDFDPERWLFEQLSLQLPVVNRCGADCPGPPFAPGSPAGTGTARSGPGDVNQDRPELRSRNTGKPTEGLSMAALNASFPGTEPNKAADTTSPASASQAEPPIDPRWAALRRLLP